ncbi:excinuclease ABC subunit UvrA [Streptomyces durbertensis]|uniref:UvrABC system protein A n=1 Tax=Streptomyces durbertensis TaxID=2448886 RepID=A0ABR6EFL7_9ACTN|nr:excinuclease ABC subunit UvrA [Streptomyces durbertensis]MBB1244130.1 excinuclease ABC subunit UvrA [Streptomyces durbertensis]
MGDRTDIRIEGAREHNLKGVSLTIPSNQITVFTGVSGSGKSSLVFDTVAVEAQRQLASTFPWFIRNQLPKYERPRVDSIENLTSPVIVDQKPVGGGARSTVGTMTDIYSVIRLVFARFASPTTGLVSTFSFNDPEGMCPECDGLGRTLRVATDRLTDPSKSLDEGAILLPQHGVGSMDWQLYARSGRLDPAKRLADYTPQEWHTLLHGSGGKVTISSHSSSMQVNYEGLADRFARINLKRDLGQLSDRARTAIERFITDGTCHACDGARLAPTALAARLGGRNISDWCRMEVGDLVGVLEELDDPAAAAIVAQASASLRRIVDLGLGYLSLDRPTASLSGGEGQRLKMVRHLGSNLIGMTYVFDEPSIGLHPRDVGRLNDLLVALRDKGNTVIVVEHDPDVIAVADHVVDVGPAAGVHGGEIVFTGSVADLRAADTATGRGLRRVTEMKREFRTPTGWLRVEGAELHNLKKVAVDFPTGVLTAVTGVAGAGKSSLVNGEFLARHPDAVYVDQSPISASSRSTPATYLGLMDPVRKLFAKANGVSAGLFSFNSAGACDECQGRGLIITELAFMEPVTRHCEACRGRRFKDEVLAHTLHGRTIADVLEMSAADAVEFFEQPALRRKLVALTEVGLEYLSLGQSLSTLSGGERQRLKLALQLHRTGTVYVLDEPTTGLHMADVDTLVGLLNGLVEKGNTVMVVEHNLEVIQQADWIVDLGPEGGRDGGEVVFTGTPAELLRSETSHTGRYLRERHGLPG